VRAVKLIQRFGSALNLNVHFHMLFPDGVYVTDGDPPQMQPVAGPTAAELQALVRRISERIARHLERRGILVREAERSQLNLEPGESEDALAEFHGHSIIYRIALGAQRGRKALMLQTLAPRCEDTRAGESVAQGNGFSTACEGGSCRRGVGAARPPRQIRCRDTWR
jgi:hypothetical protein